MRRLSARPERASEGQTVPILGAHCRRCRCVTFELRARCQPACPPHMRPTACCSRFARMQRMRRAVEPSMWTERVPGQRYACPAMLGACQCCVRAMDVGPSAICGACACCGRMRSGACSMNAISGVGGSDERAIRHGVSLLCVRVFKVAALGSWIKLNE